MPQQLLTDLYEQFNEIVKSSEASKQALIRLLGLMNNVKLAIQDAQKTIGDFVDLSKLDQESKETFYERATFIALNQLEIALQKAPEFSDPVLKAGLVEVLSDKRLYKIDSRNNVTLRMNEVAGYLGDWAEAVNSYRSSLEAGRSGRGLAYKDPEQRSIGWAKYIRMGAYTRTMGFRLQYTYAPAPYWELLDKGNTKVHMSSDLGEGAFPTPTNSPTYFVSRIEEELTKLLNPPKAKVKKAISNLGELEQLLGYIQTAIESVKALINKERDVLNANSLEIFTRELTEHYQLIRTRTNEVNEMVRQIKAGEIEATRAKSITVGYAQRGDVLKRIKLKLTTLRNLAEGE